MSKFNYFEKVTVSSTNFADCHVNWDFVSSGIMLLVESADATDIVLYNFGDSITVHGDMIPGSSSQYLTFNNRHESAMYLCREDPGGPITVRIEAWA